MRGDRSIAAKDVVHTEFGLVHAKEVMAGPHANAATTKAQRRTKKGAIFGS